MFLPALGRCYPSTTGSFCTSSPFEALHARWCRQSRLCQIRCVGNNILSSHPSTPPRDESNFFAERWHRSSTKKGRKKFKSCRKLSFGKSEKFPGRPKNHEKLIRLALSHNQTFQSFFSKAWDAHLKHFRPNLPSALKPKKLFTPIQIYLVRRTFSEDVADVWARNDFKGSTAHPGLEGKFEVLTTPNVKVWIVHAELLEESFVDGEKTTWEEKWRKNILESGQNLGGIQGRCFGERVGLENLTVISVII